jgi:hypothetical protein
VLAKTCWRTVLVKTLREGEMSGGDLMLLLPWLAFGLGVAVVLVRLRLFRRRAARPQPRRREDLCNGGKRR